MSSHDICSTGEVYGRLRVIDRNYSHEETKVANGKQRRSYYNCVCDCGKTTIVQGENLKLGITKSCGCLKRQKNRRKHISVDYTGKIINNYFVIGLDTTTAPSAGKHRMWLCECTLCGKQKRIRGTNLKNKNLRECSCQSKQRLLSNPASNLTGKKFGYLIVISRDFSVEVKPAQHIRWLCRCELCGSIESVDSNYLRSGVKDRCHNCCKKSIGESKISDLLSSNGITYIRDKSYGDCINKDTNYHFRFDFCVHHEIEGTYIIEYDGLQHFKAAPMWDNNGDLEERQRRDVIKNQWCKDHDIPLIRIPYTKLHSLRLSDLLPSESAFVIS